MNLLANLTRAARRAVCGVAIVAMSACGGGGRIEPFAPTRMLSFGDESSVIDDSASSGNGVKYTVNALKADNVTFDCSANAIWTQYLAATFGLTQPQCNPNAVADPKSRIYAAAGAKAADLGAQIDTHLQADTFEATDLVTVLVGANDVLAQYALYDGTNEAALTAAVRAAADEASAQVNRIAVLGGKVIVAAAPDLGLSPFGVAEEAAKPGRAVVLSSLTTAYNDRLSSGLINDGSAIGIVRSDNVVQLAVKYPSLYGLVDVTHAVCDATKAATIVQCTTQTLVTDGNPGTWLWADATHLSPVGQRLVGQTALTRALNNPF